MGNCGQCQPDIIESDKDRGCAIVDLNQGFWDTQQKGQFRIRTPSTDASPYGGMSQSSVMSSQLEQHQNHTSLDTEALKSCESLQLAVAINIERQLEMQDLMIKKLLEESDAEEAKLQSQTQHHHENGLQSAPKAKEKSGETDKPN